MIRPDDWLRLATSPVTSQPGKSVLTALGIAIGIAAVTLLTTLGHGVRQYVLDSFSQFGTRIIAITPGHSETAGIWTGDADETSECNYYIKVGRTRSVLLLHVRSLLFLCCEARRVLKA